jgi:hypothetical protein
VSDADVKELTVRKALTALRLTGSKVTYAGEDQLQKALPKCRIVR